MFADAGRQSAGGLQRRRELPSSSLRTPPATRAHRHRYGPRHRALPGRRADRDRARTQRRGFKLKAWRRLNSRNGFARPDRSPASRSVKTTAFGLSRQCRLVRMAASRRSTTLDRLNALQRTRIRRLQTRLFAMFQRVPADSFGNRAPMMARASLNPNGTRCRVELLEERKSVKPSVGH